MRSIHILRLTPSNKRESQCIRWCCIEERLSNDNFYKKRRASEKVWNRKSPNPRDTHTDGKDRLCGGFCGLGFFYVIDWLTRGKRFRNPTLTTPTHTCLLGPKSNSYFWLDHCFSQCFSIVSPIDLTSRHPIPSHLFFFGHGYLYISTLFYLSFSPSPSASWLLIQHRDNRLPGVTQPFPLVSCMPQQNRKKRFNGWQKPLKYQTRSLKLLWRVLEKRWARDYGLKINLVIWRWYPLG